MFRQAIENQKCKHSIFLLLVVAFQYLKLNLINLKPNFKVFCFEYIQAWI